MAKHVLRLHERPFGQIADGAKTIEARLYDEKRQNIKIGDTVEFVSRATGDVIETRVLHLLRSTDFMQLFQENDVVKFGGYDSNVSADRMREFYSSEDERRYGVLGIEFERTA